MPETLELQTPRSTTIQVDSRHLRAGSAKHKVGRRASDSDLLDAYLDFVRSMRNGGPILSLRDDDLEVLSQVLGYSVEAIREDLQARMTAVQQSKRARQSRRVAFAAFGIAIVGTALVVSSQSATSSTSELAQVRIGSALTIERMVDGSVVTAEAGHTVISDGTATVRLGGAQTITR